MMDNFLTSWHSNRKRNKTKKPIRKWLIRQSKYECVRPLCGQRKKEIYSGVLYVDIVLKLS